MKVGVKMGWCDHISRLMWHTHFSTSATEADVDRVYLCYQFIERISLKYFKPVFGVDEGVVLFLCYFLLFWGRRPHQYFY